MQGGYGTFNLTVASAAEVSLLYALTLSLSLAFSLMLSGLLIGTPEHT